MSLFVYLLKSGACLVGFYVFYRIFLEKESIHAFKRYYLLGSLALSFFIPLITFTEYINTSPFMESANELLPVGDERPQHRQAPDLEVVDLPLIAISAYLIGLIIMGIRFSGNLVRLSMKIRKNEKLRHRTSVKVLLPEKVVPHTFLKYIFLNKTAYRSQEIPEEVLLHEETHVRQKHSLDVLLLESLQVLLWFNPFIYLFARAVKLNHEFLADQAVLHKGFESKAYQNILLSYSSAGSQSFYQPALTNAINYSSFKKRFTVMKKQTSRKILWLKGLLLLPLTTVLLLSFSTTETRYETEGNLIADTRPEIVQLRIEIKEDLSLWVNGTSVAVTELSQKILQLVSPAAVGNTLVINASSETQLPADLIVQLQKELREIGIKTIKLNTLDIRINEFPDDKPPIVVSHGEEQQGASKKQLQEYRRLAKKYNKQGLETRKIPLRDLKTLEQIYRMMSPLQKAHSEPFPECPPVDQDKATPEMVNEYNALARKYNNMPKDHFRVVGDEVDRLHHLYELMSEEQRRNAERFPEFPEPPAPPQPPVPAGEVMENEVSAAVPVIGPQVQEQPSPEKQAQPVLAPVPNEAPKAVSHTTPKLSPPPPPKSPLEFAEEMAAKGAVFFFDGQQISAEKALKILRRSDRISLKAKHGENERPVIELSSSPIIIKRY